MKKGNFLSHYCKYNMHVFICKVHVFSYVNLRQIIIRFCLLLLSMTLFVCHFIPPCKVMESIVCVSLPIPVLLQMILGYVTSFMVCQPVCLFSCIFERCAFPIIIVFCHMSIILVGPEVSAVRKSYEKTAMEGGREGV